MAFVINKSQVASNGQGQVATCDREKRDLLMPLLGYSRWNEFKPVIERAILACKNTGNNVEVNFSGSTLKSQGRPGQDCRILDSNEWRD